MPAAPGINYYLRPMPLSVPLRPMPLGGSRWALGNRQALGSRHRQGNPGNDRLESSLTAVTRRPIPMVSRRVMSKGVGVGLGSQTLPDLLDLTVRDQVTVPFASLSNTLTADAARESPSSINQHRRGRPGWRLPGRRNAHLERCPARFWVGDASSWRCFALIVWLPPNPSDLTFIHSYLSANPDRPMISSQSQRLELRGSIMI